MKITKLIPPKHNFYVLDGLPFRSMTLFGALANCYTTLFGANEFSKFLKIFEDGAISSIFPALEIGDKEVFFLPKPQLLEPTNIEEQILTKKELKKIKWLSFKAIQKLSESIYCQESDYFYDTKIYKDTIVIGGEFVLLKEEIPDNMREKISTLKLYQYSNIKRVQVPRFDGVSNPFDQSEISFFDDKNLKIKMFLYFFENVNNTDEWNATKNLFIEEGIGGKRNLGKGWFEKYETIDASDDFLTKGQIYLLLSNMIPQKSELKEILYYETGKDDGFVTYGTAKTWKKGTVHYIREGAIIKSENVSGMMIEQSIDDKTIYRNGKAFLLSVGGAQ